MRHSLVISAAFLLNAVVSLPASAALTRTFTDATSTITFSDSSSFSDAVLHAGRSIGFTADSAGDNIVYTHTTTEGNFSNFTVIGAPNFAVSAPAIQPTQASFTVMSLNGLPGTVSYSYDHQVNAISTFATDVINGHVTLFHGLRPRSSVPPNSPFSVTVVLPGDWSIAGSATGNHQLLNLNPLWTIDQNFVFANGKTTFSAHIDSYVDDNLHRAELQFQLIGAPVPEPETYALMLAGLGLVGFAARRRKRT